MPGARCARSRVWCVENTRVSHRRYTRKHPAFPARWFYGLYRALPGDRAFLPPSPSGIAPQGLISASGYQDHTTSPYAAALSSGLITIEPDATASIASRAQRVVTIAIRPSVGHETAGVLKLICPTAKAENFCEEGWTLLEADQNAEVICPSGKICNVVCGDARGALNSRLKWRILKNNERITATQFHDRFLQITPSSFGNCRARAPSRTFTNPRKYLSMPCFISS